MKSVVHNIMKQKPRAILIDSSNLLHRAVWIAENVRSDVNPSYIFLTSVRKYIQKFECTNVYSVWDKRLVRGIKNYRRQNKKSEYKANRDTEKNTKVFSFEDVTTQLLNKLGVKNMYPGILEADDVISWLSKRIKEPKVIVSVDQDMLQLVDKKTTVYSPIKDVMIDYNNFESRTGVTLQNFLRYKSLMGDKSDNLPGVTKCGPKTAAKWVEQYKTDQELITAHGEDKLQPYFNNLKMIDLDEGHRQHPDDVLLYEQQYDDLQEHEPDFKKFEQQCKSLNMNLVVKKIDEWKQAFNNKSIANTLESIVNNLNLHK